MSFATGQLGRVRACIECAQLIDDEVDGRKADCSTDCEHLRRTRGSANTVRYRRHERVRARRAAMIEKKEQEETSQ